MPIDLDSIRHEWETFLKQSTLEVIVPRSSHVRPSETCSLSSVDIDRLPTRQNILIDEKITVHIVLRSRDTRSTVEDWLPLLDLGAAAYATNAVADGSANVNPATTKYDISRARGAQAAIRVVGPTCNVVWTASFHMTRPRARLRMPTTYFTASLELSQQTNDRIAQLKPAYMTSYQPLPANVLAALPIRGLYVSEDRITKLAPNIQQDNNNMRSLKGVSRRAFPMVAAIIPRLYFSALPGTMALSIEASQLVESIAFQDIQLRMANVVADQVGPAPRKLQSRDELTLLFRTDASTSELVSQTAQLSVQAIATLEPDNDTELSISLQLPADNKHGDSATYYHTWSNIGHHDNSLTGNTKNESVTFTFTAPATVHQGKQFSMHVQCLNHSRRTRNFSILPQARDVMIHTPVVKMRAVTAGTCYEANISFTVRQQKGIVDFGRIEIVDVDSQSSFYVSELPDVVATEAIAGTQSTA